MGAVAFVDDVPQSFGEIAKRDDAGQWMPAIHDELDSLKRNNTWTLVERPIWHERMQTKCNANGVPVEVGKGQIGAYCEAIS